MRELVRLNGKIVGYIKNNVYITERLRSHLFRKYSGIGLSISILEFLQEKQIDDILVIYENMVFHTKVANFIVNGEEYNDNGDKQLILRYDRFVDKTNEHYNVDVQEKL